jgi:hypothetical protein
MASSRQVQHFLFVGLQLTQQSTQLLSFARHENLLDFLDRFTQHGKQSCRFCAGIGVGGHVACLQYCRQSTENNKNREVKTGLDKKQVYLNCTIEAVFKSSLSLTLHNLGMPQLDLAVLS